MRWRYKKLKDEFKTQLENEFHGRNRRQMIMKIQILKVETALPKILKIKSKSLSMFVRENSFKEFLTTVESEEESEDKDNEILADSRNKEAK